MTMDRYASPQQIARMAAVKGLRFQWFELTESFTLDTEAGETVANAKAKRLSYSEGSYATSDPECEVTLWQPNNAGSDAAFQPYGEGKRLLCYWDVETRHWQPIQASFDAFKIRNDTGQDLTFGQIVGLGEPVTGPSGGDRPDYFDDYDSDGSNVQQVTSLTMSGVLPQARKHNGAFAVLMADIASGETGPAWETGLAWCKIDFTKFASAKFAEIDQDEPTVETLTAYPVGSAQIIAQDGEWCVVKLGNECSRLSFRGTLTEELQSGGEAKASIFVDDQQFEITVHDWLIEGSDSPTSIPSGTRVVVSNMDGKFWVDRAQCREGSDETN